MFFFWFDENLSDNILVQEAFYNQCFNKIIETGYCDMTIFFGKSKLRRETIVYELETRNSPLAVLFKKSYSRSIEEATTKLVEVLEKIVWEEKKVDSYSEFAIVYYIYKSLSTNEKKENLTAMDSTVAEDIRIIKTKVVDGTPDGKNVLFGARSFSIFEVTEAGFACVYDSANDFEKLTAKYLPEYFNISNDDNEVDSRSQKKGPEPEAVVVGQVDGKNYAFVALERIGGIMVYDITDPANAVYVNYINTRNFNEDPDRIGEDIEFLKGDVAPECMYFISADVSPSKTPILLSAFEVSGTVAAYAVDEVPEKMESITDVENNDVNGSTDSGTVDNESADNEVQAPKTGDETNIFFILAFVVCGIGCVLCGYFYKKKVTSHRI